MFPFRKALRQSTWTLAGLLIGGSTLSAQPFLNAPQDLLFDSYRNTCYLEDVNGDGRLDAVIGEGNGGGFTVYLTLPGGEFGPGINTDIGFSGIDSIAFLDYDADGVKDLIAQYGNTNLVGTFRGNGDGTFVQDGSFSGGSSGDLVASDVNGDGFVDALYPAGNSVAVHAGSGVGTLGTVTYVALPASSSYLAAGDFNGDGDLDLAVTMQSLTSVGILLGNGAGGFGTATQYAVGANPRRVATADFNADGKPDLVVMNRTAETFSVLLGVGDGTFSPQVAYSVGEWVQAVAAGDLDGDGDVDLVVGTEGARELYLARGAGDGTFATPELLMTYPDDIEWLDIGDQNGDGIADLLVAGSVNKTTLFKGLGGGSFQSLPPAFLSASFPNRPIIGDLNDDGRDDLILGSQATNQYHVYTSTGPTGPLAGPMTFSPGANPRGGVIRDVNGDGFGDLYYAQQSPGAVALRLGDGTGAFGPATLFATGPDPSQIVAGDVNGDGFADIVGYGEDNPKITVHLAGATGDLVSSYTLTSGGYAEYGNIIDGVALGDFNGDGIADLVTSSSTGTYTALGNATGIYPTLSLLAAPYDLAYPESADLNGDGFDDLIFAYGDEPFLVVRLSNGDGTFQPGIELPTFTVPKSFFIADLDGDGIPDIAAALNRNSTSFLFGNGDGTFQPVRNFASNSAFGEVAVIDLDGDGQLDVLRSTGSYHASFSALVPEISIPASVDFGSVQLSDMASTLGLVITNSGTGALTISPVLTNNGGGVFAIVSAPTSIAGNTSDTLVLSYQPTALAPSTGLMTVASNADSSPSVVVNLAGVGIDTLAPSSAATAPSGAVSSGDTLINVAWTGADTPGGSGLVSVELFYRFNGGATTSYGTFATSPIAFDTTGTGGNGTYQFYTVATDAAAQVEAAPASPDIEVIFSGPTRVDHWQTIAE